MKHSLYILLIFFGLFAMAACSSNKTATEPLDPIYIGDTTDYGFQRVHLNYKQIDSLGFEEIDKEIYEKHYKLHPLELVTNEHTKKYEIADRTIHASLAYFEPLGMYFMREFRGMYDPNICRLIDSTSQTTYVLNVSANADCSQVFMSPDKKHLVYFGNYMSQNKAFGLVIVEVQTKEGVTKLKDKAFQQYDDYLITDYAWIDSNTIALKIFTYHKEDGTTEIRYVKTTF